MRSFSHLSALTANVSAEPPGIVPVTSELVAAAAAQHLSEGAQSLVQALLRPSLRLVPTRDEAAAVGWLGGPAMIPADVEWPRWQGRGLEVVAVLDLTSLPEAPGTPLPRTGWLTFFYDAAGQSAWGHDPAQRDAWRVVHAPDAEPRPAPDGTETIPAVMLAAVEEPAAPHTFEEALAAFHETEWDELYAFGESLRPIGEPAHRIGGWPDLVQDSMWLAVQLASNGIYVGDPTGYQDPRVPDLAPGADDWRLLLQIDTDDDAAMMWGDAGRLYYFIREEDLIAGAFDRCWFKLQCG